jgi:hypothetical protein
MNPYSVIFYKQLGDVLLLEPSLAKLAAASKRKVLLNTRKEHGPLVYLMKDVEVAGSPLRQKVSTLISFTATQRAALRACLIRAESKVVVFKDPSLINWWHRMVYAEGCLTHPDSAIYRARYYFEATPCDGGMSYRPPSLLPPPAEWSLPSLPQSYVLLHATSAWKRKSWPPENWAKVLDVLHDAGVGPIVCTSGPADWECKFTHELRNATRASVINMAGRTSLRSYLATVAGASLVLCVDGSVSHIASAFQRPCVTLFGPTNPVHWHYSSEKTAVLSAREFISAPPYQMSGIPVKAVCDTILQFLGSKSVADPPCLTKA